MANNSNSVASQGRNNGNQNAADPTADASTGTSANSSAPAVASAAPPVGTIVQYTNLGGRDGLAPSNVNPPPAALDPRPKVVAGIVTGVNDPEVGDISLLLCYPGPDSMAFVANTLPTKELAGSDKAKGKWSVIPS